MENRDSCSGRMSPAHLQATAARTSGEPSKKPSASKKTQFQFLDLRTVNGQTPDVSWATDSVSLGEYMTRNIGESPNVAVESHLSQILMDNAPEKYSLSRKACEGILRRAEKRGKKLPELLTAALTQTINSGCRQVETSRTLDTSIPDPSKNQGGVAVVEVYDARGNGDGNIASTITGDHNNRVTDYTAVVITQDSFIDMGINIAPTIKSTDYKRPCVVSNTNKAKYNIRRLTPLECERLQSYPDGWTDIGEWTDAKGKTHKTSDTARYKALGNSIALPFWHWLLNRFAPYLPESPTMGSLFDGIGGFPLCWERIYGEGTAVWASEIEPFCIAVTERRFNSR